MLRAGARYHGRAEIMAAIKKGRPVRGKYWTLKCLPVRSFKAGVVVSKKVDKRAVVRNRIRRRLYEALRLASVQSGFVVVIVHSPEVATMPFGDLRQALEQQLKKADVI